MWFKDYWRETTSPLYSLFFTLPLFLIYEIGLISISSNDIILMRNGADALMRQVFATLGINGIYWMGLLFFIGFITVYIFQRKYWTDTIIKGNFLFLMLLESFIWSLLLYLFMSNVHYLLMSPKGSILVQQVILAVGAGLYEEMLFRVLLISGIASILGFIFQWGHSMRRWTGMIIAAGIFSAFHFIGEYGDYFTFNIFLVRFFAGIVLGVLYFYRGFGITSWAHSIYDLMIVTRITLQ